MNRDRALKVVLALVGLLFSALVYPLVIFARGDLCAARACVVDDV